MIGDSVNIVCNQNQQILLENSMKCNITGSFKTEYDVKCKNIKAHIMKLVILLLALLLLLLNVLTRINHSLYADLLDLLQFSEWLIITSIWKVTMVTS